MKICEIILRGNKWVEIGSQTMKSIKTGVYGVTKIEKVGGHYEVYHESGKVTNIPNADVGFERSGIQ